MKLFRSRIIKDYTAQKMKKSLMENFIFSAVSGLFSVNETKLAGNGGFVHVY